MIKEISDSKIGQLVRREELESIVGCRLSLKVANDIMGAHGFERVRGADDAWRKVSESYLEPYRKPEPVDVNRLTELLEGVRVVKWREIVHMFGMHPTRGSVSKALESLGWKYVARQREWRKISA